MAKKVVAVLAAMVIMLAGQPSTPAKAGTDTVPVAVTDLEFRPGAGELTTLGGKPVLLFRNLRGSGTLQCGEPACFEAGLDGARLSVQQDLGIVVVGDIITPLLGRVRGTIQVDRGSGSPPLRLGFLGDVTGEVTDRGFNERGKWAQIQVHLTGPLTRWTDATGHMDLSTGAPDVLGDFAFDLSGEIRSWTSPAGFVSNTMAQLAGGGGSNILAADAPRRLGR